MKELKIEIEESQRVAFVERFRGEVFHVTFANNLTSIKESGEVFVNSDCSMKTTFGDATNSIFRKKGCVSVFDYESPTTEKWHEHMWKCDPLHSCDEEDLAFLILSENAKRNLIRWEHIANEWKAERVVPHVEAGHTGAIQLSDIKEVIVVSVKIDPDSLTAKLNQARKNADKRVQSG